MLWYWVTVLALVLAGATLHVTQVIRFRSDLHWSAWLIVSLVLLGGGWMAFDAAHALIAGDYITPQRGEFAGQLGPWSKVVQLIGIDPRSAFMKTLMLAYGIVYLAVTAALVWGVTWAWSATLLVAVLGLWYLPFGTVINLAVLGLLLLPRLRASLNAHN